jgi:hypothetical protein
MQQVADWVEKLGQYAERFESLACSRRLRPMIVAGSITFFSSILILDPPVDAQTSQTATGHREDSSDSTAVVDQGFKDKINPEYHFEGSRQ